MNWIWMKKPYGYTFEVGMNENKRIHWALGAQRFGKLRPRARIQESRYTDTVDVAYYGGIRIDFGIGTMRRPIAKIWKKEFWSKDKYIKNTATNPWNSGNHWKVLTLPIFPYVFLSVIIGHWKGDSFIGKLLGKLGNEYPEYMPGFNIGFRTAYMDQHGHQLAIFKEENGKVKEWVTDENGDPVYAWGSAEENDNVYTELTVNLRSDFIH